MPIIMMISLGSVSRFPSFFGNSSTSEKSDFIITEIIGGGGVCPCQHSVKKFEKDSLQKRLEYKLFIKLI